jgi:hypothetical protein
VGADRQAGAQQVAGDVVAAVGAVVVGVVAEGLADPERVERLAVEDRAPGALVGGDVEVDVGEAEDRAVRVGDPDRPAGGAGPGLGRQGGGGRAESKRRRDQQGGGVFGEWRQSSLPPMNSITSSRTSSLLISLKISWRASG